MMRLIDTHSHVYLNEFDDDRAAVLQRAKDAGVERILMPAIDTTTHEKMLKTEADDAICQGMMGLHPCSVGENFEDELAQVHHFLESRRFWAVGEIGLDFYWDRTYEEQQYEAFRRQIGFSLEFNLPIVIHSRNSIDECIATVKEFKDVKGVFHCFSGTTEQARQIMELGMYLGIGGVATFKNGGLDKVLPQVGLSQVVLETDAPYLAPVPYRGKRNEPAYVKIVAEKLADILQMDVDEVAKVTTQNAEVLFGK